MRAPTSKKAFITPEEVAAAAEYRARPRARNVAARTLASDGSWTAQ